jgi:hypothetical protein
VFGDITDTFCDLSFVIAGHSRPKDGVALLAYGSPMTRQSMTTLNAHNGKVHRASPFHGPPGQARGRRCGERRVR